jgi:hypothetical protein
MHTLRFGCGFGFAGPPPGCKCPPHLVSPRCLFTATVVLCLSAAAPLKVAVPPMTFVGVDAERGAFIGESFSQALGERPGISVLTARDMAAMLGMERQRQLLGCDAGGSSCTAELANALGVDAHAVGELARLGAKLRANVRLLRASDGTVITTRAVEAATEAELLEALERAAVEAATEAELLEALERAAREMSGELLAAYGREATDAPGSRPAWPWVVVAAGGALAIGGGALFAVGKQDAAEISRATAQQPLDDARAAQLASRGSTLESAGVGLLVGGAAVAVAGVAAVIFLPRSNSRVALAPLPGDGALVAWSGTW